MHIDSGAHGQSVSISSFPSPPHRVSNLEAHTRLEAWNDLVVEAGGIEGQRQLFREVTYFQLHFRADFLSRKGQKVRAQTKAKPIHTKQRKAVALDFPGVYGAVTATEALCSSPLLYVAETWLSLTLPDSASLCV